MDNWLMLLPELLVALIILVLALDMKKHKATDQQKEDPYYIKKLIPSLIALGILYIPTLLVSIGCLLMNPDQLNLWRTRTAIVSSLAVVIYVAFRRIRKK